MESKFISHQGVWVYQVNTHHTIILYSNSQIIFESPVTFWNINTYMFWKVYVSLPRFRVRSVELIFPGKSCFKAGSVALSACSIVGSWILPVLARFDDEGLDWWLRLSGWQVGLVWVCVLFKIITNFERENEWSQKLPRYLQGFVV